jgi:hypothetical protein
VLGQVRVVSWANETKVGWAVVSAHAKRVSMVEFEAVSLGASATALVDVAAAVAVPLTHGTPDRGRDVARSRRGVSIREPLAGSARPGVTPGFDPFELLADSRLDDRGQVAVGHLGTHQGREPLELVAELNAGSELDLVAVDRQRLHDRAS